MIFSGEEEETNLEPEEHTSTTEDDDEIIKAPETVQELLEDDDESSTQGAKEGIFLTPDKPHSPNTLTSNNNNLPPKLPIHLSFYPYLSERNCKP